MKMTLHRSGALFSLLMLGCGSTQKHFDTVDEAGSFGLAVLSVEDWSSFKTDGQPKFTLTAEEARVAVLPNTGVTEEQLIRTLGLLLKAALPTTSTAESLSTTKLTTATNDGSQSTKKEEASTNTSTQREDKSGDVTAVDTPKAAPTVTGSTTPQSVLTTPLGTDAQLQYLAATALYQYVQILNRYVLNAVMREGYRPILATLQVSLQPTVRNAPYDAYASLMLTPKANNGNAAPPNIVHVVPLLNTDNLEGELASRADSTSVELALGILASIQGVGLSAGSSGKVEALKKSLGHKYNSLVSVSRMADNLLRIRMGAQLQSGEFAMVPRTHLVPVLLLVPCGISDIDVMSRVDFVDAEKGKALELRSVKQVTSLVTSALKDNNVSCPDGTEWELFGDAFRGDVPHIEETLRSKCNWSGKNGQQLALDLLRVQVGSAYASASFEVPSIAKPDMSAKSVSALLDDGKASRLRIAGLSGMREAATLFWLTADKHRLFPDVTTVNSSGTAFDLQFPSASQLGLARDVAWKVHGQAVNTTCKNLPGAAAPQQIEEDVTYLRLSEGKAESTAPVITFTLGAKVIKPNADGKATLGLKISRATKGLTDPIVVKFTFKSGSNPAPGIVASSTTPPGYQVIRSPLNTVTVTPTGDKLSAELEVTLDQLKSGTSLELSMQSGTLPVSGAQTIEVSQ